MRQLRQSVGPTKDGHEKADPHRWWLKTASPPSRGVSESPSARFEPTDQEA